MIKIHIDTNAGPGTLAYEPDGTRALLVLPERAAELTAAQCLDLAVRLRNAALVLQAAEIPRAAQLRRMGIEPSLSVLPGGVA